MLWSDRAVADRTSLAVVLCLTATLAAQDSQTVRPRQQPTFGADTQAVRVDVYLTRDSNPVTDLRRDEVEVFEDDVRQTIQTFQRIAFAAPRSAAVVEPRTLERSREMAADPRSRIFVVFVDTRHTSYVSERGPHVQARFPVFERLEQHLGADDLVALMTPDMRAQDLTFARGLAGLARLEATWRTSVINPDPGMLRDPKVDLYESCFPPLPPPSPFVEMRARHFERKALDALDELVRYLGDLRDERKGVFLISDGWRLFTENPGLLAIRGRTLLPTDGTPRLPRAPIGGRGRDVPGVITERGVITLSEAALRECEEDRLALASLDHPARLREITARANRSNVSFYPLSAIGLTASTTPPGGSAPRNLGTTTFENQTSLDIQSTLRALADDTGGVAVVNTNNLAEILRRIMSATSAYYLLGYTSSNGALDGRYRRISVRVARSGVDVHARPGYVAATRVEPASPVMSQGPDPIATALTRLESAVRRAADEGAGMSTNQRALAEPPAEMQLFRRGAAARAPYVATSDPRFRRSERMRLEAKTTLNDSASARLLDRRGAESSVPVALSERGEDSGAFRWIVADVTLAPLAIGDYLLEIMQGDARRLTAFRVVP